MTFTIESLAELPKVAQKILSQCVDSNIILFYGNLGAGKTTFIKSLCHELGFESDVTSPTFSLVNEYEGRNAPIFHMDLYRLKNTEEALEIGIEEYLYSGHYCFIEWPQMIVDLIDQDYYKIEINVENNDFRKIEVNKISFSF